MSETQPTLETARLCLRPLVLSDARDVQRLAGDRKIAEMTLLIPHPYEDGLAEEWIGSLGEKYSSGKEIVFAIVEKEKNSLIGSIGLRIDRDHDHAELGYWIGKPFWGRGYCTEAVRRVVQYAFDELKLHRVHAHHFGHNPASGRVLEKIGMTREGFLKQHIKKWDRYRDIVLYGMVRDLG